MVTLIARHVAEPAPLAEGEVVLSATVDASGTVAVLATTEPTLARGFVRGPHGNRLPWYEPPRSCPAVLLRFDAGRWQRVSLAYLPVSYPRVALLPDGDIVVVSPVRPWSGTGWSPHNAHVFGPDGSHRRALSLGEHLEEIAVDDVGTIWTTHGEQAWPEVYGLVRWDVYGQRLWDSGVACADAAVNVRYGVAWAHRWPTSLIRIYDGVVDEYACPVGRVTAIAFTNDRLLLVGEAGEASWCSSVDGVVERLESARFVDLAGEPIDDWTVLASHGSCLYLDDDGNGFRYVDVPSRNPFG
jgi:hypothetical protein